MAAVDISAPVCETREEQGGDLVNQATSILISKLPNEEQIEAQTHDGHSMVEGDNFLTAPSIGEVHCEVNNSSPDDSMVIEKPVQTVKDETDIVPLGKPKSDDQPTAKAGDVEPIEEDILEYPKSGNILDNPAESLHVAPENIEESILGQEKIIKSFPEDQSTNRTLNENAGGETEEKSIDAVDTQEEILENDFSNVSNEDVKGNSTEHGEPKNVEFCENESTKSTVLKIESKLEKPEDHLHATSEDINAPEIETRSCIEEQSVTTHPQGILDEKTEDEAVDAAEREGTIENVPTVVSIEQTQDDSLIQVGGPKMETEDRLEKDAEQPSPVGDFTENIVTDEVKIDDRAQLLEEEFTESVLLEEEVKQEKALESLHAVGHLAEDPDSKQEESSVTEVPEVHMVISHENVPDVANLASEVVEEEDSCGDKTVTKETAALDDGSTMIPTNETLPETDPRGGTEAEVQVQDEVKIDDRAELLEEEDTESVLLKDEVQKEKPLESSHAETTSLLEEKSLTENPQENLCEETEEKIIDAVSNEDNSKDSLIQVDAIEMEQGAYLEKEDANHDESINLVEPKIGNECNEDLHNASEDHKASASSEDIETTPSHKEESLVMSDNTIDPNNTEEATHEIHNVTTEIQHVHTEENSVTQVDCSQIEQEEHLEKDGENSSWTEAPIEETKADESKNIKELEGIDSMKAELTNEKDTESISVKEEAEVDNPIDSLPMANQDIIASDSTQDTKKCIMEQLPTANPEELSRNQTEKESVDAAEAEESLEDIVSNIPDGDNADNTPIEEDGSQEPSLEDATTDNNNAEEPSVAHEAKPVAENEKITECTSVQEEVSIESSSLVQDEETSSLEEKSLTTNPRGIMDDTKEDKTNGAIVAEEQTSEDKVQENIGETTPHEDIKENLQVQEDYPQLDQKIDLENDSENTSSKEVLIGEAAEDSLDNEETQVEKPLLQVPTEDKASESCQEAHSIEEKVLSADPEEIPCDKTEETTVDSAYTKDVELQNVENVPNEGSDNSQTEVEGQQKTSLEETSIGNNNDAESTIICDAKFADENIVKADLLGNEESIEWALVKEEVPLKSFQEEAEEEKHIDSSQAAREEIKASDSSQETNCYIEEKTLPTYPQEISSDETERESIDAVSKTEERIEDIPDGDDAVNTPIQEDGSQKLYLKEAKTRNDDDDESTVTKEATLVSENEKDIESTLVKEEVSTELLQVAAKDTEVTVVGQDRETSSLEVQSVTTNPRGLMDETKEDKTSDTTGAEEETPEDKDVATTPYEDIEENLPVEVDCKQVEENEDLVNVSENTSLTEALTGDTGEGSLVKEEAHDEKHLESLQVATEDVQASNSSQEKTSSVEEKILVDDSQEISCDRIEEKTIDAAYTKKENLEEVVPKISNASDEDSSPIQVDGLQKPPLEEALTIIHEANFAEESKIEADLFQNETKTEFGLVKEEVSVKSLQVENEDIKPIASSEDREISHLKEQGLTTDPQETVGDYREGKTIDVTELKDEALEDKSDATTSHEDTTENSLIQVDCIQLEKNETLEKASESTSLTEAPTEDTIEKAEEEDHHIETLHVATEDIKESASCQETSSTEEQILTADSQEISCDRREEKTTDSAYTEKESFEDVATNVPSGDSEDSSPIEGDGSQKPSLKEASTENTSDHESTIQHDTKSADYLSENEKNIECDLTKEETPVKPLEVENEDTKATTSNQDRETGHMEEQGLITNPQGIVGDHTEDKVIDVTDIKEVTREGKSYATISYEDTTENSSVQVDCSQLEQNEHSEKDNEITPLTEALAKDTTEITLVKEEAQNEDHTESFKVATEDIIKAFSPCQDNETSSTEEQVLIIDPEDISRDKIIEKTIDASDNEKTTEVQVENEDIKVTAPSQEKETSHLEEQGLETNPQGIIGDHKEDKTVDVPDFKEENHEDTSYATTPHEDSKENSFVQVDCSPLEQNEHSTEALAAGIIESTVVKEEAQDEDYIESLHSATEDAKAFAPSQEEQILTVDPEDISSDKKIENITDASDKEKIFKVQEKNTEGALKEEAYTESSQEATEDIKASNSCEDRVAHSQEDQTLSANPEGLKDENRESETFPKDEMPNEIENVDFEARNIELKEEEGYLKDMSTAVNIAVHEEKDSDLIAVKIPCTEDLDVVEEGAVGHLAEEDSKQEESSITEVPEVDMVISHENVPDAASLASEVVEEANSCGSTMMPTNETLPETDSRGCTKAEVQVPDVEKEAELVQHDLTTETDQQDIEGQVLIKDSQVISESEGVNDEEEKTNSDNCEEISGSSNSGALEEESASNFQESRREMKEEAENEEDQKQEEELHVSALFHDSSSRKIENHVQELEKAPLPASDENIIETECNESETVEDAIKYKEGVDRTESFFDEKKATEREQEETESRQEKSTSDENVQTTTSTSDLEVIDFLPVLPSETSKVDLSSTEGEIATDKEELNAGKITSDANEDTRIDNNRSITDLESINDDEAEVKQTTPSASEGQDVESTRVGETTSLISECNKDGYENDNTSSATEESPDSKVVLESVSQVAETEETKTEGKNLETAGEIESERIVAEDISGQEESKHETEILKTKEENEVVVHQACHQEEVIIGSHLEEEANQEEISTGFEDIKKENETEKVTEISKEADDKAFKRPEETLLGKESIDSGIAQKEQSKSVQEVTTAIVIEEAQALDVACVKIGAHNSNEEINMSSVAFPRKEENRTRADDTENEIAEDEGLPNQNSKTPVIDAAERELPKELDENITCEAPINTFDKTIDDSEVKKEQQEEHITRNHEILPLPELVQGKDSEKYNQKDEICGLDEVQPRDEENVTHSEEKSEEERKGDTWSKPKEGEETEPHVEPEQFDFSFHIKDILEVPSSDDAQVIPEDKESHITKNSPEEECSNKSTLEFEDQQVKLHDLPGELNITDTEVMAEKDDPENLQNARDVSQDDQGPNEGSSEVSIKENPVEVSQDENIKTSEEQETEAVQNALVLETFEQETEEQKLGRTPGNVAEAGVDCEEGKIINDKSNQLENSWSAGTEKVSESNTCQNLMDVTARHDKVEGSPRQIGSLSILPEVKCSEIETTERDIPVHSDGVNGTGVAELEVTPIPSKDKHIVLEADHTTVLNSENANGNEKLSAECSQGEHDLLEPSKVEQKEADCRNEARTDQETTEKTEAKEADKPSLSDLLSMRETSKVAEHSAIGEEPTTHKEDRYAEKPDEDQDENAKTEEEHDDKDEHKESESSSEAPVMVDMADADVKVSHKKSHNILSGVGSKVKHSIAKVKKVITGKSSHPKPPSPVKYAS